MRMALKYVVLVLLVTVAAVNNLAQATNPIIGTWKLNLAKSKYDPGPPPRSQTRTYEDRGNGLIVATFEGINAQGNAIFTQFAAKYDGKDYPFLVRGSQTAGSIALKAIDAYTVEASQKEDGKATTTTTRTVARDGKTMTLVTKGRNAQGQSVNNVVVFERQ